jgi:putative transposase
VVGRKRHLLVDTTGLVLAVMVTAASLSDVAGAKLVLHRAAAAGVRLKRVWADSAYRGLAHWAGWPFRAAVAVVTRAAGQRGFAPLARRWVVERTFAWLGRCRRLSKDREKSVLSSESFIKLAMIQSMLHRLRPSDVDAEFHYPRPLAA